jgi:hypothetical protein
VKTVTTVSTYWSTAAAEVNIKPNAPNSIQRFCLHRCAAPTASDKKKFMKKQCESKFTGGFLGFAMIQNESSCIQHGLIGMQHQLSQHNLDKFGYLLR